MSLEHKLRAAAEPWLSEEVLSDDRAMALEEMVRRRRRRPWGRWVAMAASVAAVAYGVLMWPLVVSVASGTPVIGPFIARMATVDEGAHWAEEKGYVVPVDRSAQDQGYTFRVESVLADAARTVIYYVIDGPELEKVQGFPHARVTYNKMHPPGGSIGRAELVDGRIVGSIELAPLTTPTALVDIHLDQMGEVRGDWSLSFLASRMELERMAKVVRVNHRFQGEGYDLTLNRILLAPTQTIIEMKGTAVEELEVRPEAILTADGVAVQPHGATYSRDGSKVEIRMAFDRVDPEAAGLTFELKGLWRWHEGGLSLDLQAGARAEHGAFWMEYLSTEQGADSTTVMVVVPWNGESTYLKDRVFRDWTIVDANGQKHIFNDADITLLGEGRARFEVMVKARLTSPVRLESRAYAEPVPGEYTVRIPLK